MKLRSLLLITALCGLAPALRAAGPDSLPANAASASDSISAELTLMDDLHNAARGDKDDLVSTRLEADHGRDANSAASVILAQRALKLCSWLRNEGDWPRAAKLARRTIARLSRLSERTNADRVERLYLEAMLETLILDHKARALALLEAAEKLAPDDERILSEQLSLGAALAEFGR